MYKTNDYVIYKRYVCKIKAIKNNDINVQSYYVLMPIDDETLTIEVPVDNKMGYLRKVMSKKEAETLINNITNIKPIENIDDKYIEKAYKDLLYNGTQEDLIKIIKTTYLRNENRIKNNKKISDKDNDYFNKAEKYLYNELSIVYNMDFTETKNYIINRMKEIIK